MGKLQKMKCNTYTAFCFHSGWWTGHVLVVGYLRRIGRLLHVCPQFYDQETDGQMDHGGLHFLLLHLHRRSILPGILHLDPGSHYFGTGSCSHVERQVYLSVSGYEQTCLGGLGHDSNELPFFSQVGNIYGELTDSPVEPIIVRFFGIFFLFFQSSSIWGNLISSAGIKCFFTCSTILMHPSYSSLKLKGWKQRWCS